MKKYFMNISRLEKLPKKHSVRYIMIFCFLLVNFTQLPATIKQKEPNVFLNSPYVWGGFSEEDNANALKDKEIKQRANDIKGKITDSYKNPLPGVTIIIKGTAQGTTTDANGEYVLLNVPENAILVISFIGMKTEEIAVDNRTNISLIMKEETIGLDEVVAIGYGTMRKSDLTGSVTRVSMEDKSIQANTNLFQALVGTAAGVNLESRGGSESLPSISVRGQTSLSASDAPLVVIDGIIYNGSISNVNLNDIETIDILKDASAAAVYGSRSANGVLLITTKKGKIQKPRITLDAYVGWQDMTNNPMRVMNGDEFAVRLLDWDYQSKLYKWYATNPTSDAGRPVRPDVTDRNEVAKYLVTQEERDNYLAGKEIDWVKEVLQVAPMQNYSLGVQGGAENVSYYLSASYSDIEGIQLNDKFKRLTIRSNMESTINKWLTLGLNASYSYIDRSGMPASLANARVASPLVDNKIGKKDYDIYLGNELFQPYPLVYLHIDNSDISNELFAVGNAKITVPWIEGLKYELNYSQTFTTNNINSFHNARTPSGVNNKGLGEKKPSESRNWIVNNIVTYTRDYGNHQINSTLLLSREQLKGNGTTATAEGFDNEILGYNNLGLGTIQRVASSAYEENSISYMARVNYTYLLRYMLTATVRKDGFSGFGKGNKWATFPSLSLAWVITEEPFFKNNKFYLKLRTSYGKNGNQGIGRYASLSRMGTRYYVYGSETAIGLFPSTLSNPHLGWETTTSYNLGVDFGFLNNRITGSIDLYTAKTEDVLVERKLPRSSGYVNVWSNIGKLNNKGLEIQLKSLNVDGQEFKWESNFTFSLNRDKIIKLYGYGKDENKDDIENSWFVGKSISAIYDYEMAGGVWTEQELFSGSIPLKGWYPGQFRYVDQNNDGIIEPTKDRTILGYKSPSYRFSIGNHLSYKNFTLSVFINSIQGGKKYYKADNALLINPLYYMQQRMNNSAINRYWRPDAPTNNTTGIYNNPPKQSGIYQSRSFVRLQDISLSYNFNKNLTEKIGLQHLQIYVSSKNPYVWTKWQGWDPEIGVSDTPLMRNIIIGTKLSF